MEIPVTTLIQRLNSGWTMGEALEIEPRNGREWRHIKGLPTIRDDKNLVDPDWEITLAEIRVTKKHIKYTKSPSILETKTKCWLALPEDPIDYSVTVDRAMTVNHRRIDAIRH